eukprot:1766444-Alexandrium_andersonii.AAC.1
MAFDPSASPFAELSRDRTDLGTDEFFGVCYMDDTALAIADPCPLQLMAKIASAIDIVVAEFAKAAYKVNFKPAKTE